MKILIVEDDPAMSDVLSKVLADRHFVVNVVPTVSQGEEAIAGGRYDAIVIDWRLPDGEGIELVRHARQRAVRSPIIMLTARTSVADRIAGLDAGADDYLGKPFALDELLARLRALQRRPAGHEDGIRQLSRLSVNLHNGEALLSGQALNLTRRERLVLAALARRVGKTVMRQALEDAVYGFEEDVTSNTLDAHVSRLRRKLADVNAGVEIHTIRGVGYLLRSNT